VALCSIRSKTAASPYGYGWRPAGAADDQMRLFMGSNDPQTKATTDAMRAADLGGKVKECLIAARRKVHIAEYHLGSLRSALAASERPDGPSVPVQAHFEGVLYSVIAASEQVDKATERGSARILRCNLEEWQQEPILRTFARCAIRLRMSTTERRRPDQSWRFRN